MYPHEYDHDCGISGREAKFNAFLHPNEHPERICVYLVRQFDAELVKIGHIFTK